MVMAVLLPIEVRTAPGSGVRGVIVPTGIVGLIVLGLELHFADDVVVADLAKGPQYRVHSAHRAETDPTLKQALIHSARRWITARIVVERVA